MPTNSSWLYSYLDTPPFLFFCCCHRTLLLGSCKPQIFAKSVQSRDQTSSSRCIFEIIFNKSTAWRDKNLWCLLNSLPYPIEYRLQALMLFRWPAIYFFCSVRRTSKFRFSRAVGYCTILYCITTVVIISAVCKIFFTNGWFAAKWQQPVCRWTPSRANLKQHCLYFCTHNVVCSAELCICMPQDGSIMLAQLSTRATVASAIKAYPDNCLRGSMKLSSVSRRPRVEARSAE